MIYMDKIYNIATILQVKTITFTKHYISMLYITEIYA